MLHHKMQTITTITALVICALVLVTEAKTNKDHSSPLSVSVRSVGSGPLPPPLVVDNVVIADTGANDQEEVEIEPRRKPNRHHMDSDDDTDNKHDRHGYLHEDSSRSGHRGNKERAHMKHGSRDHEKSKQQKQAVRKEGHSWRGRAKSSKLNSLTKGTDSPCSEVKCKRKQMCFVNPENGTAECLHRRELRERKKQMKLTAAKKKEHNKKQQEKSRKSGNKKSWKTKKVHLKKGKKLHKLVKKMKNKAERFNDRYTEKKRHKLHHFRQMSHRDHSSDGAPVKSDLWAIKNDVELDPHGHDYCSEKDLAVMSKRLLDWFKVIQDQEQGHHDHVIQKRNSRKKELHDEDECICQAPVRYEFLLLDKDEDDILSVEELQKLESNGYEHCIDAFVQSCDHDLDGQLTNKEWCCCFADVLPPCLADMARVPAAVVGGSPSVMPGAMVPQCDDDGFYLPLQCHSSTGYCWCVDRAGIKIEGTHTRGSPDCEHIVRDDNGAAKVISESASDK